METMQFEQRLAAYRDRAGTLTPTLQYLTGLLVGFSPALVFALVTVLYSVTHAEGWGAVAVALLWLSLPVGGSGLLCLATPRFRWLGAGLLSALVVMAVVTLQVLAPVW